MDCVATGMQRRLRARPRAVLDECDLITPRSRRRPAGGRRGTRRRGTREPAEVAVEVRLVVVAAVVGDLGPATRGASPAQLARRRERSAGAALAASAAGRSRSRKRTPRWRRLQPSSSVERLDRDGAVRGAQAPPGPCDLRRRRACARQARRRSARRRAGRSAPPSSGASSRAAPPGRSNFGGRARRRARPPRGRGGPSAGARSRWAPSG